MAIRIGVLTLPLNSNYGGILQAYALQRYLQDLGFFVVLLNRRNNESLETKLKKLLKSILYKDFAKTKSYYETYFIDFIKKKIPSQSPKIYSKKELENYINKNNLTHIITGSDQVWRYDYSNITDELFLNIGNKIKRASYAASFGFDKWNFPEHSKSVSSFLKKFDSISVREDSGIKICKTEFGVDSEMHLDPTLLLTAEHYINLVNENNEPPISQKLLTYLLDPTEDKFAFVKKISDMTSLAPYLLEGKDIDTENHKSLKGIHKKSIYNWLRGFYDCEFVITDSYHGTLFALLFNKPFLVLANKERGVGRFSSILAKFNLEERLILDTKSIDGTNIIKPINYDEVNKKMDNERLKSKNYLMNFIRNA